MFQKSNTESSSQPDIPRKTVMQKSGFNLKQIVKWGGSNTLYWELMHEIYVDTQKANLRHPKLGLHSQDQVKKEIYSQIFQLHHGDHEQPCGDLNFAAHLRAGWGRPHSVSLLTRGERKEERVSYKPSDKREDERNSVTLHNDVTKNDEELNQIIVYPLFSLLIQT